MMHGLHDRRSQDEVRDFRDTSNEEEQTEKQNLTDSVDGEKQK